MLVKSVVSRRGILKRTTERYMGAPDASEELAFKSSQDFVTRKIQSVVSQAINVLKRAGHPIEEGFYREHDGKNFVWIGAAGSEAVRKFTGKKLKWPFFLPVEPLTKEEFAVKLIQRARFSMQTTKAGQDNWELAAASLLFADDWHWFRTTKSGIAEKADQAVKSVRGSRKGNFTKTQNQSERSIVVLELALQLQANPKNSWRHIRTSTTSAILEQLQGRDEKISRGEKNESISMSSIYKDLGYWQELGKIEFGKSPGSAR